MKKRFVLFAGVILSVIMLAWLVNAQSPVEDLKALFQGATDVLTDLAEKILGSGPTGQEGIGTKAQTVSYLFARVLFLLIVFVIVWAVVSKLPIFSASTWMVVIISGAVALLSTRFLLSADWVQTILLPYSVFGIAVTAFLPLLIYFYFVESAINSRTLRKIAWILALFVFLGLWWSRSYEIKGTAIWVYPVAGIACFALFAFDGTIHRAFNKVKAEKALTHSKYIHYNRVMNDIKELKETRSKFTESPDKYNEITKLIQNREKDAARILSGQ